MNDYLAYRVTYSNELYHYGVKGQKWGIRRYQNPNGTLTEEGKIRYEVDPKTGKLSDEGKKLLKQDIDDQRNRRYKTFSSLGIGVSTASAVASGIAWSKGLMDTTTAICTIAASTVAAGLSTVGLFLGNMYDEYRKKESNQKGANS